MINPIFSAGEKDNLVKRYIMPRQILWHTSDDTVGNRETLLAEKTGQSSLAKCEVCVFKDGGGILLDFGIELQGGIQIIVQECGKNSEGNRFARFRVRFGESATEAMSELGFKNSTNDHAPRDTEFDISFNSCVEIGGTGFRFVRLDLLTSGIRVDVKLIRAVFIYRELEYRGSFTCSDALLNRIWDTSAYTVHLNMQRYLWDGIKRDRLVWIGDMHPEVSTILAVFGYDSCVPDSLDFVRDETVGDRWMNNISTYSMWWIKIHYDWYIQNGNNDYLRLQRDYLYNLVCRFLSLINDDGTTNFESNKYLDWPSSNNPEAVSAGFHAIFTDAVYCAGKLFAFLGEGDMAEKCRRANMTLKKYVPNPNGNKQAASLMALAGISDAKKVNREILVPDPVKGLSTFLGYYVLLARAAAGDTLGAVNLIREYWGGMLKMGATTFWEDFDIDWLKDALPIDRLILEGHKDLHGDNGGYCYEGFRHSLCHGWASGPAPFLSRHVLGVNILEPGCRSVRITPCLDSLDWVRGTYPTPHGVIYLEHEKDKHGKITSHIEAPSGVTIIK